MGNKWVRRAVVVFLILLPLIIAGVYRKLTALPKEITIATGAPGGVYRPLSENLAGEIEEKLKVKVHTVPTNGSLENFLLLQRGKADFALYQANTADVLKDHIPHFATEAGLLPPSRGVGSVAFIANLYSQPAHFIVRRDAGIESPADLKGKTVNLGLKHSGTYAMSLFLLQHFGLDENSFDAKYLSYPKLKDGFLDDTLDAAFITSGVQASIYPELFATGKCDILSIPYAEALAEEHVSMSQYKIPAGRYRYQSPAAPASDIHTVAFGTQLLTRSDVHVGLVEEVTKLVLSEDFTKKNELAELFARGLQFAQEKPEFDIHRGAERVYNPDPSPLLPPDFVDATEGIRSFIFSILIAGFLGVRWLRQRNVKEKERKLDGYIQSLLEIEQQQLSLAGSEVETLQKLLDKVTFLKQEALGTFAAHELNDVRAADCFIGMCHALSDKINAKISRQQLDKRLGELVSAIDKLSGSTPH
ncbi:MAG: TAXI family TRAP transporter solute-binding subunit [Terriglobia bacterium]